ncbi:hypothetical protein ACFV8T_17435 [Streptomyces sp. NPDC059832]|uniref:hypothetical protein n=1 Tax=Streptomyces sp. NPDC059832 TaxID=3346966 RepID=UPI00364EE82D
MDFLLPERLGAVERDASEAARAVTGNFRRSAVVEEAAEQVRPGHVQATRKQWLSVLWDAELPELQRDVDETVVAILDLRGASGRTVGKRLPALLRRLHATAIVASSVAREVSRFHPSRTSIAEQRLAADLARAIWGELIALFDCLEQGWAEPAWAESRRYALAAQVAAEKLVAAAEDADTNSLGEDVYRRTLGIPAEQLSGGTGAASRARLAAAWATDRKSLDRRLRRSMRHLIDESVPMTGHLCHHLAHLAVSDRPLVAHRAALLGRDLVMSQLESAREQTCSVIARHVAREPEALFSHRGVIAYQDAYIRAEHPEEKARAAMDLYRAVFEGDVKRTAAVVLELEGGTVPQGTTLATLRDLLAAEDDQSLCSLLGSTIRPEWRNANAHEDFRWDPVSGTLLLSAQPTDLEQVLDEAIRARSICLGFEHGVAVAYARKASLVIQDSGNPNHVDRDLSILQSSGESRFPVLDIRRQGRIVRLDVVDISVETLRDGCRALLRAALADPGVERWEIRQSSPSLPAFVVDRAGIEAGLLIAEPLWETSDPMPFAELPLLVNAMNNAGEPEEATASTVLVVAASHVFGEKRRLATRVTLADPAAKHELITTAGLVGKGAETAARLLDGVNRRRVAAFSEILAGECQRLENTSRWEMVHAFASADRVLRRHAPARFPWIKPSSFAE